MGVSGGGGLSLWAWEFRSEYNYPKCSRKNPTAKMSSGKNAPGQNIPRSKCLQKCVHKIKLHLGKNVFGKNAFGQNVNETKCHKKLERRIYVKEK